MIMRPLLPLLILLVITSPIRAGGTEPDFDIVCNIFSGLEAHPDLESFDQKQRSNFVMTEIQKTLPDTSDARAAWEAISHATPGMRYELFKSAADSSGFKNWECPSMEVLADVIGEM